MAVDGQWGDHRPEPDPPGAPIFVDAWVRDGQGQPVEGAEVDVWHTSAERFYSSDEPNLETEVSGASAHEGKPAKAGDAISARRHSTR